MASFLKYLLCCFVLVAVMASCSKDAELLAPVPGEAKGSHRSLSAGGDGPERIGETDEDAAGMDLRSGGYIEGDYTGDGITDDDDEDDEDDENSRAKSSSR
jgi:hypothetical protein